MLAHPDLHAASAELGTTTLHDQLNLHGASFSTQMHV
jgi:hypothetical protein